MQKSEFSAQKQIRCLNTNQNHSLQSLELVRIPQKRFHRTTWSHIMLRPGFDRKIVQSSENHVIYRALTAEMEVKETNRWIQSKKIFRLHNWKGIQTSASIEVKLDIVPVKKVLFVLEQNICKINKFTLTFGDDKNFTFHELGTILYNFTKKQIEIHDLSLSLKYYQVTERQVNFIRKIIRTNLPNLRSLRLSRATSGNDTKRIASQLTRKLTTLKAIYFSFGGRYLPDSDIIPSVARDITNNLPDLEELGFHFMNNPSLKPKNVKGFAEQICRKLVKLKCLHLNFEGSYAFEAEGLKALSTEMSQNLVNLRVFTLIVKGCKSITKAHLDTLKNDLSSSLPNLKYLFHDDTVDAVNMLG